MVRWRLARSAGGRVAAGLRRERLLYGLLHELRQIRRRAGLWRRRRGLGGFRRFACSLPRRMAVFAGFHHGLEHGEGVGNAGLQFGVIHTTEGIQQLHGMDPEFKARTGGRFVHIPLR